MAADLLGGRPQLRRPRRRSLRSRAGSLAGLLAGAVCTLITIGALQLVNGQLQQQAQTRPAPDIAAANSINLQSILDHQQALARDCHQLKQLKLAQLRQVAHFRQHNDQVYLSERLAVRLPAVCVFLFGPPEVEPASSGWLGARLELVNWVYDAAELAGANANNLTKRHTDQLEEAAPSVALPSNPLNDYLFDVNSVQLKQQQQQLNELDDPQLDQFREQTKALLGDGRFRDAIQRSRPRLNGLLSPVVLVPGLLGSRLQGRVLAKRRKVNIFCSRQSDWQDLWLSLRMFLPLAVDCWLDNVRLEYDPQSGFARPPAGFESRVPDFGSVESVRHLDLNSPKMTKYFNALIERYEQLGYTPDLNLFAAPYDFRLAPQQLESTYFVELRQLIERARVDSPGGTLKATLVCHSMGCTHSLVFLRQQSAAWRQANVRKLIALSSPWAGTVKALKALLVGDQLDLPLVSETKMRKLARNYPSIAYLLPQANVFERPDKNRVEFGGPVLVQAPSRQYRVGDLERLLTDFNLTLQWRWFEQTSSLIKPTEPLDDLHVDCIHSLNVPTVETLIFRNQSDLAEGLYEQVNGDGDGTVNHQSLLVCADWAQQLPGKVRHRVIMNTNHLGVLSHPLTLSHITDDVLVAGA